MENKIQCKLNNFTVKFDAHRRPNCKKVKYIYIIRDLKRPILNLGVWIKNNLAYFYWKKKHFFIKRKIFADTNKNNT